MHFKITFLRYNSIHVRWGADKSPEADPQPLKRYMDLVENYFHTSTQERMRKPIYLACDLPNIPAEFRERYVFEYFNLVFG